MQKFALPVIWHRRFPVVHGGHGVPNGIPTALRDWWMGLSRESNLLVVNHLSSISNGGQRGLLLSFYGVPVAISIRLMSNYCAQISQVMRVFRERAFTSRRM